MTTNAMPTNAPPVPATMLAAVARRYGSADVVSVEEIDTPSPGDGQVLVEVHASSLNALDWHFLTGTPYFMRMISGLRKPKRLVHGADVAGIVVSVGSGATRFSPGDAVFGESGGGGFGQFLTVNEAHLVAKPDSVSFEAAGATPVAGLTAVQGLRTKAQLKSGEHVLINGAAGGVGTFAVQIAKALGAEVTGVCSARNVDMVRSIGADHVIDYGSTDFVAQGHHYDVMLDNVGNRTPAECISVLKDNGRYVAVSGPKENQWFGPVPHLLRTVIAFKRSSQSFHQFTAMPNIDDLGFLGELLETQQLVPQIQRTVGLDGVVAGLHEISTGHTRSKIVVRTWNEPFPG